MGAVGKSGQNERSVQQLYNDLFDNINQRMRTELRASGRRRKAFDLISPNTDDASNCREELVQYFRGKHRETIECIVDICLESTLVCGNFLCSKLGFHTNVPTSYGRLND